MKFKRKTRERVNNIIRYIESLGGKKINESTSGSIYCELEPIKKIRIADHLSSKAKIDNLHIIIQKENRRHKYICIFNRNLIIYDNVGKVKQWIYNIYFIFNVIAINGFKLYAVDEEKLENIKNDIINKDQKLKRYKKEIEEKDNTIKKLREKLQKASEYHNKWQKSEAYIKKLSKKLENYI